jgi:glycosyltransferase involved in cell wall biosynthesis
VGDDRVEPGGRVKVIHVVPRVSDEASGPSYSVTRLCESLIQTGADVRLASLDERSSSPAPDYVKHFSYGLGPRRLGVSPGMRRWLEAAASSGQTDVIHNHGLWMMPNVYPGWVCRENSDCGLVVSPRGTLSAWALHLNAIRKRIFWALIQGPALRNVACFHATAPSEYESIRAMGFTQPVCIVPNGIDVPLLNRPPLEGRRRLLFLGRIHPIKGIDVLLKAWAAVEGRFADWELHLAGPDSAGYLAELRTLAATLGVRRVVFRGPLYGADKLEAYREASLFVLPTHSENFGMSVAEALAAGTPAIVTKGAPWPGLTSEGAGWWIDHGVDSLAATLETALVLPEARLAEMGIAGRTWMLRDYSWQRIGTQTLATYHWLTSGGQVPDWVRVN